MQFNVVSVQTFNVTLFEIKEGRNKRKGWRNEGRRIKNKCHNSKHKCSPIAHWILLKIVTCDYSLNYIVHCWHLQFVPFRQVRENRLLTHIIWLYNCICCFKSKFIEPWNIRTYGCSQQSIVDEIWLLTWCSNKISSCKRIEGQLTSVQNKGNNRWSINYL